MAIYPLSWVNMALHGLGCPCTGLCCQGYMADQCLCWSKQWVRLCSHFWLHFKLGSWVWNVTGLSGLCSWAWMEVMWPPRVANASHVMAARRRRASEFELGISRVPGRVISGTLLRKNSRKFRLIIGNVRNLWTIRLELSLTRKLVDTSKKLCF